MCVRILVMAVIEEEREYTGYDSTQMFLRVWSPEEEPRGVIIVVHGLGAHSGLLAPVGEYFAERGYYVYGPDLRGFGHYTGLKGHIESIDEYAKDLDNLVETAKREHPGKKVFMFGHSLGGLLTILYCEQFQLKLDGFIVVNPGLKDRLEVSSFTRAIAKLLSRLNVKKLFPNGVNLDKIAKNPEVVRKNKEDPLRFDFATARLAVEGFGATERGIKAGGVIAIPALVQVSGEDMLVDPEGAKEFYDLLASADKTYKYYEELYHEPFMDEGGEQVLKDAVDWLDRHL